MPHIEINERLYNELKKFADFLKQPLEDVIEGLLEKDLEWIKDNSPFILDKFLSNDQVLELIFSTQ